MGFSAMRCRNGSAAGVGSVPGFSPTGSALSISPGGGCCGHDLCMFCVLSERDGWGIFGASHNSMLCLGGQRWMISSHDLYQTEL